MQTNWREYSKEAVDEGNVSGMVSCFRDGYPAEY